MVQGIILAGGAGTRLYPLTRCISKHLLPIYDKPLIYYPLSILMLAGIRDILIISTPKDLPLYQELFGTGEQIGIRFSYTIQETPRGLADAFIVGEKFIGSDPVALILGDNIFYGQHLSDILKRATSHSAGATIFGYYVSNPSSFGVIEFDADRKVISIEEKPKDPKSHYAVPGLYFYDNDVVQIAKSLSPSARGELEITDVNTEYLKKNNLHVELFGRGMAWLDSGTHDSLLEASQFIETIQKRQGLYVACIEEIAYQQGFINQSQLIRLAQCMDKTEYGQYLMTLATDGQ